MKEYLVTFESGITKTVYIVLAKNAKDAIEQVITKYFQNVSKSSFRAKSTVSLHNEQGKILEPIESRWR